MVDVVDERNSLTLADREQVGDGELAVVVLQCEPLASRRSEPVDAPRQPIERGGPAARRAAPVERERLGADERGERALELELGNRRGDDVVPGGVEDDELVGVKREPDVVRSRELPRGGEGVPDRTRRIERLE